MMQANYKTRATILLGSARVSRLRDRDWVERCVLAIADFSLELPHTLRGSSIIEVRFGETPKPARETRALPMTNARNR
jgi:hypothetical protein